MLNLGVLNGTNGFILNGIDAGDSSGTSVSSAGDVNGDGYDDLIIGARSADPNGDNRAGETYIVYGGASAPGTGGVLDLSGLDGTNGFILTGIDAGDRSGTSVSSAGDVNGDGYDDLIIGADRADPNGDSSAGETYIVYGGALMNPDPLMNNDPWGNDLWDGLWAEGVKNLDQPVHIDEDAILIPLSNPLSFGPLASGSLPGPWGDLIYWPGLGSHPAMQNDLAMILPEMEIATAYMEGF